MIIQSDFSHHRYKPQWYVFDFHQIFECFFKYLLDLFLCILSVLHLLGGTCSINQALFSVTSTISFLWALYLYSENKLSSLPGTVSAPTLSLFLARLFQRSGIVFLSLPPSLTHLTSFCLVPLPFHLSLSNKMRTEMGDVSLGPFHLLGLSPLFNTIDHSSFPETWLFEGPSFTCLIIPFQLHGPLLLLYPLSTQFSHIIQITGPPSIFSYQIIQKFFHSQGFA